MEVRENRGMTLGTASAGLLQETDEKIWLSTEGMAPALLAAHQPVLVGGAEQRGDPCKDLRITALRQLAKNRKTPVMVVKSYLLEQSLRSITGTPFTHKRQYTPEERLIVLNINQTSESITKALVRKGNEHISVARPSTQPLPRRTANQHINNFPRKTAHRE